MIRKFNFRGVVFFTFDTTRASRVSVHKWRHVPKLLSPPVGRRAIWPLNCQRELQATVETFLIFSWIFSLCARDNKSNHYSYWVPFKEWRGLSDYDAAPYGFEPSSYVRFGPLSIHLFDYGGLLMRRMYALHRCILVFCSKTIWSAVGRSSIRPPLWVKLWNHN